MNWQITGPFQIFRLCQFFFEKVVSAQLCFFLQKNDIYKNFSQVVGPTIAQKLHLLKLQIYLLLGVGDMGKKKKITILCHVGFTILQVV